MRCGTKTFIVEYETDKERVSQEVAARSSIKARKTIRNMIGQDAKILSCRTQSHLTTNKN